MPYREEPETQTAQVKVAYVNPPKGRARNGSIKSTDNRYYGIAPSNLNYFKVGGTYEIEYSESDYQGRTYATIHRFKELSPPPVTANGAAGGAYRETSAVDAERMFVTAIIRAGIQSQAVALNAGDLISAIQECRQAWQETFGAKPKPAATRASASGTTVTVGTGPAAGQRAGELNDEIPF